MDGLEWGRFESALRKIGQFSSWTQTATLPGCALAKIGSTDGICLCRF